MYLMSPMQTRWKCSSNDFLPKINVVGVPLSTVHLLNFMELLSITNDASCH